MIFILKIVHLGALGWKDISLGTFDNHFFQCTLYISYLFHFFKGQFKTLINSSNKINVMTPAFTIAFGFTTRPTNVGVRKIDGFSSEPYGMVSTSFSFQDSRGRVRFIKKIFFLVKPSIKVILSILFLALSNADIKFHAREVS